MNLKKINPVFEDARGTIADIFYKAAINHVAILYSKKGSVRGNHFHKKSHQHMYIIEGSLRYYTKAPDAGDETIQSCVVKKGDLVSSPPGEVHAMEMLEDTTAMVFTEGLRGGKDFEKDTFRVKII